MQVTWRERDTFERINMAYRALEENPECASALVLLAEEECKTVRLGAKFWFVIKNKFQ